MLKNIFKTVRYWILYVMHYHKLAACGKHTVMIRPLRIMGGNNITIGDYSYILNGLRIEAIKEFGRQKFYPHIEIGDRVEIGQNCHISCVDHIVLEDDVTLAPNVMINDSTHGYKEAGVPIERQDLTHAPIRIGKGSLIGYGAVILPGVNIGEYSFIGAGCIIAKDVPSHTVVCNHENMVMKTAY